MRASIRLVAAGITIGIFMILNLYWTLAVPKGSELDLFGPAYWIPFAVILGCMFAIAFYFYSKSKQKTRIKL
jgi:hypothetical protein